MNSFFKPSKAKIIIFIILFSLSTVTFFKFFKTGCPEIIRHCEEGKRSLNVPWQGGCNACMSESDFKSSRIMNSYLLLIWPQLIEYFIGRAAYNQVWGGFSGHFIYIIFPLIYYYFISCIFFYFKDRLKK